MNAQLAKLFLDLNQAEFDASKQIESIKDLIQVELNQVFDADADLKLAILKLEASDEYTGMEDGLYQWSRYEFLADYSKDVLEYFQAWLSDSYGYSYDAAHGALMNYLGDDCLIIQDDTRRDNGVWQGRAIVIDESLYVDEDGEVDVEKRNALIESHMDKTGYYPGVFRVDYHGNVFSVNTIKKEKVG